jgi:hypothetical protein
MRKGNIDKTAIALGVSQRRVHGLVAQGVLPKPKCGVHNIAKCIALYDRYRIATDKAYRIQKEREQCQRDLDAGRPLRLSSELAAEEFGISERRLRERLRQAGLL